MVKKQQKHYFIDKYALGLILLGSVSWILTMIKSGLQYPFGIGFWGPNGHDGIWHIALANSLSRGSLEMPTFAGYRIQNYHLGFDMLLSLLHSLTGIRIDTLYFQVLPVIFAFAIGFLVYIFILQWKKSPLAARWALFFIYFGGSLGWVVNLLRHEEIGGESMFWSQQAVSTLLNPPFALSLITLLLGLICMLNLSKKYNIRYAICSIVLFGILIEIKAYAGILALGGLFVLAIYEIFTKRKINILKIFISSLILSLILFIPLNRGSGSILVWQPFWFLETMLGLSDRLNFQKLYSALMNYKLSKNYLKEITAYVTAFLIFLVGNMGARIIQKRPKQIDSIYLFIISLIGAGILIPMLFLQKGTPWNTIQFFYYSLFFAGILSGISISGIHNKKILYTFIILLIIPTTFATLAHHYLPARPPAKIGTEELQALNFLAKQENGVVLTYLYDEFKAKEAIANPPRPLYLYDSTAYVSAYSNKPVFLEDQVNLDITGYDWRGRRQKIEEFYKSVDQQKVYSFLRDNHISYVYWLKGQRATLGETQLGIQRIYENKEVDIYKVK